MSARHRLPEGGYKNNDRELDNRAYFKWIYLTNSWGAKHTRSGPGSEGASATQKVELLRNVITSCQVQTNLDIGCGDVYWMKEVFHLLDRYLGIDIVPELICSNTRLYESETVRFIEIDLTVHPTDSKLQVSKWDLITCFDVFGHLSNKEVESLLGFLINDAQTTYLLMTNRRDTHCRDYLTREKSRHEGIDIEAHPLFAQSSFRKVEQWPGLFKNDWFDLYKNIDHP